MRIRKDFEEMPDETIVKTARVSEAFAHPGRIKMFRYIMKCNSERKPVRNKDLVSEFDYSQATISQHLNKLVVANVVETKNEGTSTYYFVNIGAIGQHIELLKTFE